MFLETFVKIRVGDSATVVNGARGQWKKGQAQWPERPRWNPWFCYPPANDFYTAVNWVTSR